MNLSTKEAPRIIHYSWGRILVDGAQQPYKDAKLFPGGSRAWNWEETGTRHSPGIQPADIQELLDHGAEEVILSQGMLKRLQIPGQTIDWLRANGVKVHILPSGEAVRYYNQRRQEVPVGALIHTTC